MLLEKVFGFDDRHDLSTGFIFLDIRLPACMQSGLNCKCTLTNISERSLEKHLGS